MGRSLLNAILNLKLKVRHSIQVHFSVVGLLERLVEEIELVSVLCCIVSCVVKEANHVVRKLAFVDKAVWPSLLIRQEIWNAG